MCADYRRRLSQLEYLTSDLSEDDEEEPPLFAAAWNEWLAQPPWHRVLFEAVHSVEKDRLAASRKKQQAEWAAQAAARKARKARTAVARAEAQASE